MTGSEVAQIITALGSLIAALASAAALIMSVRNSRGIERVRVATDGMKDELVAATAQGSLARGTADGLITGHAAGLAQGRHEERPAKVAGM